MPPHETTRPVAPEDLSEGDAVTISRVTFECVSVNSDSPWSKPVIHEVKLIPPYVGQAYRVVRVCLPFVLVKDPEGEHHTLDIRRHHLVFLSESFAKKAFKCFGRKKQAEVLSE